MKKFLFASIIAMGAIVSACDDDGMVMPANPDPAPSVEAAGDMLIYEANPQFFASRKALDAVNARLDDIKSMGTNVLWIMPVCEPGEKKAFGSPYCIRDFKAMNPAYGSVADLKTLVDNAHGKGMRVILDWIANHTAWDCAWITDHPEWYTRDAAGNIISPEGQNWTDVADLNYDNAEMRAEMIDAMLYWVRETGIDGFRCDYADGVPTDFWTDAISSIRALDPDAIMLAETADFSLYDAGFDMIYDWSTAQQVQKFMRGETSLDKALAASEEQLAKVPAGKSIMRYVINHDVLAENSPSSLYGSAAAMPAAQVLVDFLGGTPMVYSGQEAGVSSATSFMNYRTLNWDEALVDQYGAIGSAYKTTALQRAGKPVTYEAGKAAVMTRANGDHVALLMVNPTSGDITVKVPISLANTTMTDALTGLQLTMPVTVTLEPYSYAIYFN